MADLFPAAQAVLDASNLLAGKDSYLILAAALRAAADQVVPEEEPAADFLDDAAAAEVDQRRVTRAQLLAIAAELNNSAQPS
jgi:hypothetical protein